MIPFNISLFRSLTSLGDRQYFISQSTFHY